MNLRPIRADLHIHTCLSPCGELEMTPRSIIRVCKEKSIDMIAICDHNTAENVKGVQKAAEGTEITVLAGMEVTTAEEVHLLALFDEADRIEKFQDEVYTHLLPGENDENLFGIQVVANELDEVETVVHRLLIGGTTLTLEDVIDKIHELRGLAIASHIDRESFSLVGQLGMIPDNLAIDALEVSPLNDIENVRREIPGATRFPLVTSSDAHRLDDIGKVMTTFLLEEATLEEIGLALKNIKGRRILKGETSSC